MATIADINAEARDLCDADTTSYPAAALLRRVNAAYETVISWILTSDGMWQWDDDNFTTDPVGTGTLTSGQHLYSFADKVLDVIEVNILDLNGIYKKLIPWDAAEHEHITFEEYFNIDSGVAPNGIPQYYDKVGNTIVFDRAPTAAYVTLASGLQVKFKRTADLFTTAQVTTGTKVPGFASPFHYLLSYMAAIPYNLLYHPTRVPALRAVVGDTFPRPTGMKKALQDFYQNREKDSRKRMTTLPVMRFR